VTIAIRRAEPDDLDFLLGLVTHDDVEPFLAGRARLDREGLVAELERSRSEPEEFGRFVIELDGERVGSMGFEVANRRSKIAQLERLAVHPSYRGRGIADEAARLLQRHLLFELGYHRLQLEVYGFNERAIRHAERAGFVREGVRRKAYWRHDRWNDAVLFGLLPEDLDRSYPPAGWGFLLPERDRGTCLVSGSWLRDRGGADEFERSSLERRWFGELGEGGVGAGDADGVAGAAGEFLEQAAEGVAGLARAVALGRCFALGFFRAACLGDRVGGEGRTFVFEGELGPGLA